jgi:hypothetical protein
MNIVVSADDRFKAGVAMREGLARKWGFTSKLRGFGPAMTGADFPFW